MHNNKWSSANQNVVEHMNVDGDHMDDVELSELSEEELRGVVGGKGELEKELEDLVKLGEDIDWKEDYKRI